MCVSRMRGFIVSNDLRAPSRPPAAGLTPLQTWALALVPSQDHYTLIVIDRNVGLPRAYVWLTLSALIGGIISTLVSVGVDLVLGPSTNPVLASLGSGTPTLAGTLNELLFGVPIQTVVILVAVTIVVGASQMLASALGGRGTFTQLLYAFSAFFTPLLFFNSLISSLPLVGVLVIVVGLYALLLNVIAIKTVHQIGAGRAFLAGVVTPIGLLVLVSAVAFLVLSVTVPLP